jgi:hypothetical protein
MQPNQLSRFDAVVDVNLRCVATSVRSNPLRAFIVERPERGSVEHGFEVRRNNTLSELKIHTRRLQVVKCWATGR